MNNIKALNPEAKKRLFKALLKGLITKNDIKEGSEVVRLLNQKYCLIHIKMGEINSYSFDGNKIDEVEFNRLSTLSKALGIESKEVIADFGIKVIDTGYPLANSEDEIIL
ncbi:MAG: hypothetical protein IPM51_16235 [Sphingobacteriaceae bacterium]|nr:hypothetical protein [Sphingobacteriaceae bacterium]